MHVSASYTVLSIVHYLLLDMLKQNMTQFWFTWVKQKILISHENMRFSIHALKYIMVIHKVILFEVDTGRGKTFWPSKEDCKYDACYYLVETITSTSNGHILHTISNGSHDWSKRTFWRRKHKLHKWWGKHAKTWIFLNEAYQRFLKNCTLRISK